jgi:hypothetical protein
MKKRQVFGSRSRQVKEDFVVQKEKVYKNSRFKKFEQVSFIQDVDIYRVNTFGNYE